MMGRVEINKKRLLNADCCCEDKKSWMSGKKIAGRWAVLPGGEHVTNLLRRVTATSYVQSALYSSLQQCYSKDQSYRHVHCYYRAL